MFRKLFLGIIVLVLIFGPTSVSFAQNQDKAVNVGNKICPVTGEKIDENTKVTYEYQGKIYNFCCAACPEEFKKDPEKYIKKVEEELQEGQASNSNMPTMDDGHSGMHHGQ